jgi:hypothetical protein
MSLGQKDSDSPPAPFLGVVPEKPDEALLAQLGRDADEGGVVIREVTPESPASRAGLQPNDLIIELDGQPVRDPAALSRAIHRHKRGDTVSLKYLRQGRPKEVRIKLGTWKTARIETITLCPAGDDAAACAMTPQNITIVGSNETGEAPIVIQGFAMGSATSMSEAPEEGEDADTGQLKMNATMMVRDDQGMVEIRHEGDTRHAVVKDPRGKVLFDGVVGDSEAWKKAAPEVRARVEKAEQMFKNLPAKGMPKIKMRELHLVPPSVRPGFIRHELPTPTVESAPEPASV